MLRGILNGHDLESRGVLLGGGGKADRVQGWLAPPARRLDEADLDGIGAVVAEVSTVGSRTITIPISVHPPAGDVAARLVAEAWLFGFLTDPETWLRLDDEVAAREMLVHVLDVPLDPTTPGASVASRGRIVCRAPDPRWRALEPTLRQLSTTPLTITGGSAPIGDWTIRLANPSGAVTDPGIVIRAADGTPRTTITLPGTLATTDYLELRAGDSLAQRWSGGTATTILTTMVGAFVSLVDGDTVALTAASGTPLGELLWHPQDW